MNQGPLEIAAVFLGGSGGGAPPTTPAASVSPSSGGIIASQHHLEKLRKVFREFLAVSKEALQVNAALVGQDQREYQLELEREPLVESNLQPVGIAHHISHP